ncbi:hypothetical protein [Prochlorococcus marinus]|uniref:hypothetical protein n=1 Tax=Prochlorococcus marinus TaxID=1219 RepID=UPI001CEDD4B8|nr:hypothetical protein [Prochlorococcus marinus]
MVVFAEKDKKESREINSIRWEKVQEKNSNNLEKIIWKSYKDDESYFQNEIDLKPNIENLNDYRNKGKDKDKDIFTQSLNKRNRLLNFGGITVSNALIPNEGTSQINLNYDSKGNLFGFYGYSLSNIFQLELSAGSFDGVSLVDNKHSSLQRTFLSKNNFNYRVGGKLLILSPQNFDPFWMTFRTSFGSNEKTNQGYLITELINTIRINDKVVFNISPKYFFSEIETFGAVGISSYINLLDNLQLIPEINTSLKNEQDFSSSLGLRYSFRPGKSIDLYYSNAAGVQDIGQLLEDKVYRFGIKLNFIF